MKRPLMICILCILLCVCLMLLGDPSARQAKSGIAYTITLLSEDDTGAFLSQLKQGAQAAAREYGDRLTATTLQESPNELIAQLKSGGTQAVLLFCQSESLRRATLDACRETQLPVILCGERMDGQYSVSNNDSLAGALAAQHLLALGCKSIVLLTQRSSIASERLQGASAVMQGVSLYQVPISDALSLDDIAFTLLRGGAGLLALTEEATLYAVEQKKNGALGLTVPIVGMDTGDARAEHIERGMVQGMVLPAPYAIGYMAGRNLHSLLETGMADISTPVAPKLITLANLYEAENVRLAFPLLQ